MPPNPYRRQPNINDMMYPKGSKQPRQVWAAVMNVPQPSSGAAVTPTPTATLPPTPTPSPTTTLTSTPTTTLTSTPTPSPTTTLTSTPTPSPTTTLTSTPTPSPTTTLTSTPTPTTTLTSTPTPSPTTTLTSTPTPTTTLTSTPTNTPTPTATTPFNTNAATYLNAVLVAGGTGITPTISAATNTLFTSLTSAGLYSKLDVFYPMLGGTAASTALNGSRTSGTTFDIFWIGSMSFNSSGATGSAVGAYGNTHYVANTYASPTNNSNGYYAVGGNLGGGNGEVFPMGAYEAPLLSQISYNSGTNILQIYGFNTSAPFYPATLTAEVNGSYISTFDSTPTKSGYRNYSSTNKQVVSGTSVGSAALPIFETYLFVLDLNGSPYTGQYYTGRIQFAFMGDYLTPSEVQTLDGIINTFQTTIGRNTY